MPSPPRRLTGRNPVERFEQMVAAAFTYYNRDRTGFALMTTSTDIDRALQGKLMERLAAAGLPDLIQVVVGGVDAG